MIICIYLSLYICLLAAEFEAYWLIYFSAFLSFIASMLWEETKDKIKRLEKQLSERSNNNEIRKKD